jgi:hypothetical protein
MDCEKHDLIVKKPRHSVRWQYCTWLTEPKTPSEKSRSGRSGNVTKTSNSPALQRHHSTGNARIAPPSEGCGITLRNAQKVLA